MKRPCLRVVRRRCAALIAAVPLVAAQAATLEIACELHLCKPAIDAWAARTGHEVRIVTSVGDSNDRLAFTRRLLEGAEKTDIVQMDIVWPALLAGQLVDLGPYTRGAERAHLAQFVENNTVEGRLVALPWFADIGLMFYRRDLLDRHRLKPPRTWDELAAAAAKVQAAERAAGNRRMWGYVWQGRAYEGLTCNALEWIASHGGGRVVDASGGVGVDNPAAIRALKRAAGWIGTITPRAVLDFGEEESRGVFSAGNAVFLRHWPYAWSASQREGSPVKGKVGVMPIPAEAPGGASTPMLGGWLFGVSSHSKNPALAADLVLSLTGPDGQRRLALQESLQPTLGSLYAEPEVAGALPLRLDSPGAASAAITRPSTVTGSRYARVSELIWQATHDVLAGRRTAEAAVPALQRSLLDLRDGGAWK